MDGWKHGFLTITNIGRMKVHGKVRTHNGIICSDNTKSPIKGCTITKRADGWFVTIIFDLEPQRDGGEKAVGFDWGVETYVTCAYEDGSYYAIENDRYWQEAEDAIVKAQQALANKPKNKRTKRREKAKKHVASKFRKLANKRKDRAHKTSAWLVKNHGFIGTEKINVKSMTKSAKGTIEEPGKNVAQKAGLNREILDTAPADLIAKIKYKAEEAGVLFYEIDTFKHKPSQTCPECGHVQKKELDERIHDCQICGFMTFRDEAAARVCLNESLKELSYGVVYPATCSEMTASA